MQSVPAGKPDIAQGQGAPVKITLLLDGKAIAERELPYTIPLGPARAAQWSSASTRDRPVNPEYKSPFRFTGGLKRVVVDVSGEPVADHEAEMKTWLRKQ